MDMESAYSVVLETLHKAASQDVESLKPAEEKMKSWETIPGYYSILLHIYSNHAVDNNVRWLAILCLKNGIDRYWRKNAPHAISEAEKVSIRQGLILNFREPVNQIAVHLAVLLSKIARYDYPREWRELIPTLMVGAEDEDLVVQHRSFLILYHVIKTLSSKRLAGDRKIFQDLTENVFTFILTQWNGHLQDFLSKVSNNNQTCLVSLEKSLLCLRILRKLVVYGYKTPSDSQEVVSFINVVFERTKTMLEVRKSIILISDSTELRDTCEKFIIHLTKNLLSFLEEHPLSFVEFIPTSLEFATYYVFSSDGEPFLFERFLIQCLNLVKGIVLAAEFRPAKNCSVSEAKNDATIQAFKAQQMKTDFFTESILSVMCRKLVTHYFLLKQEDLELWDSDPESFATDEGGESWKYTLRPCTESVFLALFHEYKRILSPVLMEIINDNHAPVSPTDLSSILRKDAVYNAVGLAAFDIYDEVDFNQWFTTTLSQELNIKDGHYRVIRRRIAWLLGQWSGIKLSPDLRPALYALLLPLLQGNEDMAVRIAASTALKLAVDDFDFSIEQFEPFIEPSFNLLFLLLKEAKECDTKMHVLHISSFIVERVGFYIKPYSVSLCQYLPLLWAESKDHNMLRCAIISTLVQLLKAFCSVNENILQFSILVIQHSTDFEQEASIYLLEDGLELWLGLLENITVMTPKILQLFVNMPPLLELSSDHFHTCLYIIQAYILLAPEEFLKTYGSIVINICDDLLSDMTAEAIVATMRLMETSIRAAPLIAVDLLQPILSRVFEAVSKGDDYPMVMSMYLSIMSRVLLCSRGAFSQVIQRLSQRLNILQETLLEQILDVWCDKMSVVTQLERRKLLALALSSLLTVRSPVVLHRFCGILLNVAEVLNDVIMPEDLSSQIDSLVLDDSDPFAGSEESEFETEHGRRKHQLARSDPIHNIGLREYFQSQINELKKQVGPFQFEQLVQTVDSETLDQVREYVTL